MTARTDRSVGNDACKKSADRRLRTSKESPPRSAASLCVVVDNNASVCRAQL